jgi:hypothetical protein
MHKNYQLLFRTLEHLKDTLKKVCSKLAISFTMFTLSWLYNSDEVTNQKICTMQTKQDVKIPFDKHNTDNIKGMGRGLMELSMVEIFVVVDD